jgi:hypothetical protein
LLAFLGASTLFSASFSRINEVNLPGVIWFYFQHLPGMCFSEERALHQPINRLSLDQMHALAYKLIYIIAFLSDIKGGYVTKIRIFKNIRAFKIQTASGYLLDG